MSTIQGVKHTYEEYLQTLKSSPLRFEYHSGEIHAMDQPTPLHAALQASLVKILNSGLGSGCRVMPADSRVRVDAAELCAFPDVTVVCGEQETSASDPHAITNPTLLVEVTSDATEEYDLGEKVRLYKELPSLYTIAIVSHRRWCVTVVERTPVGWQEREADPSDMLTLQIPHITFSIEELYRGIDLTS